MHDPVEDSEKLRAIYSQIKSRVSRQKFESCVFPFPCASSHDQVAIRATWSVQPCGALKRQNIVSEADAVHQELATAAKKPRIE